jgi:hypothetical protein
MRADRATTGDVVVVNPNRFLPEPVLQLLHRLAGQRAIRERPFHPLDSPEEVDRCWACRSHQVAGLLKFRGKLPRARGLAPCHAQRNAHRRGDADGRRATNHHGLDRPGDVVGGRAGYVDLAARKLALIDHHDGIVLPGNRWKHRV